MVPFFFFIKTHLLIFLLFILRMCEGGGTDEGLVVDMDVLEGKRDATFI